MNGIEKLGRALNALETKYQLNEHKIRMLSGFSICFGMDKAVRVSDVLKSYKGTSRATTHKLLQELVGQGILGTAINPEDYREKRLVPGKKYNTVLKDIERML